MDRQTSFNKRIGAIKLPEPDFFEPKQDLVGFTPDPRNPREPFEFGRRRRNRLEPPFIFEIQRCNMKEGCYKLFFTPRNSSVLSPRFRGTLRVERRGVNYRISGDLYVQRFILHPRDQKFALFNKLDPFNKIIPVYSRRSYRRYLKGTGIGFNFSRIGMCPSSLTFDEFDYNQPASGFNGSFPTVPSRSVRFSIRPALTSPNQYTGKAYEGSREIGTISLIWVSSKFRRATLEIHTLEGATAPETVGGENFETIFAKAGWDLSVVDKGTIPLPASLDGVQDPNQCWSQPNSAELMESVPGYDPAELDRVWKTRLLCIPAQIGCSRGRMFDSNSGDPNAVPREGAVTHSHDGYPAGDSGNFGDAEGEQQKDVPRAFLRSAAHEVGHAFNQIHQNFESGNDNSVMTVTPSVANVLNTNGQTFPDDIELAFNEGVRRHLIHQPDPAVRPGGMAFFGSSVGAPEADQVIELDDEARVDIELGASSVRLGEPVQLSWDLINNSDQPIPFPAEVDIESLVARINVTDPDGAITYIRPAKQRTCCAIAIENVEPTEKVSGETTLFWGRDGFAFQKPGRHVVEVIVLWEVGGVHLLASGRAEVWVAYPLTDKENQVAALLLHESVGHAVAVGDTRRNDEAVVRIKQAVKTQKTHPACKQLNRLGL